MRKLLSFLLLSFWVAASPAKAGCMSLMGAGSCGGAPPAAVTLDPANKGAAITLSGGNLTATNNAGTDATVKSTTSHSTGKFYFEVTVVAYNRALIGTGNASATLNGFVGSDANGIGYFGGNGNSFVSGAPVTAGTAYTTGNVVSIALDLTNGNIWQRVDAGNWNANPAADPATNTGGASLSGSGVGAGPYFAAVSPGDSSTTLTVNFGATSYAQTPPSGFGNW